MAYHSKCSVNLWVCQSAGGLHASRMAFLMYLQGCLGKSADAFWSWLVSLTSLRLQLDELANSTLFYMALSSSLVAQVVNNLPAMWKTQVQSLGKEDPLKGMATYSSILAWRIPWTEEPTVCGVAKSWTWLSESLRSSFIRLVQAYSHGGGMVLRESRIVQSL